MTLSINTALTQIAIVDTLLNSFIASPTSYTNIVIAGYFNSNDNVTSFTYTNTTPITTTTEVASVAGEEHINPAFFNITTFNQGVYRFVITLTSPSTVETSEGCLYVDNGLKCKVDTYMLNEANTVTERVFAGLKYRSLSSSIDCPCKCDNLFELYDNLIDLTNGNCKTC